MTRQRVTSVAIAIFVSNVATQLLMLKIECRLLISRSLFRVLWNSGSYMPNGPFATGTAKEFVSFVKSKHISAGAVSSSTHQVGIVSEALDFGRAIRTAKGTHFDLKDYPIIQFRNMKS